MTAPSLSSQEAIQLAGYHYLHQRYAEAEALLLRQLAEDPADPYVLFNLAVLAHLDGRFALCTEYCERAVAGRPSGRAAWPIDPSRTTPPGREAPRRLRSGAR